MLFNFLSLVKDRGLVCNSNSPVTSVSLNDASKKAHEVNIMVDCSFTIIIWLKKMDGVFFNDCLSQYQYIQYFNLSNLQKFYLYLIEA